jgi:hypothetical protein
MEPARRPLTPLAPNRKPMTMGENNTRRPGANISLIEDWVEISMHLSYSGGLTPDLISGSLNYLAISLIIR